MVKVALGVTLLGLMLVAWWWLQVPRTPGALYRARCATCHALPDMCAQPAAIRMQIVQVMLTVQHADEVIDDTEALSISRYLREDLACR